MVSVVEKYKIATVADIEGIEKVPFEERITAHNTFEFLKQGAEIDPEHIAIWFMMTGKDYTKAAPLTYEHFLGRIHQTANMLNSLGLKKVIRWQLLP